MTSEEESNQSHREQTPAQTSSPISTSKDIFKTPAQQITLKLDEKNFLSWKQLVGGINRTHKLHRFLVNPTTPLRFLTEADRNNDPENPAYLVQQQQDSLLFTWLLTISQTLFFLVWSDAFNRIKSVMKSISSSMHISTRSHVNFARS